MPRNTYTYSELDAIAQSRAANNWQRETGCCYEKNWERVFAGVLFYCDGTRSWKLDKEINDDSEQADPRETERY